jgi:hypothetical protein
VNGIATVLLEGSGGLPDAYGSSGYVEFGLVVPILYGSEGWGQPNDVFCVEFIVVYLFEVFIGYCPKAVTDGVKRHFVNFGPKLF